MQQPALDDSYDVINFVFAEPSAFRDLVPFLQATPAAGGRGVLGDKGRVVLQRGLAAVIGRLGRGEPGFDELAGVSENDIQPFLLEVCRLPSAQPEPAAKFRFAQRCEEFVDVTHCQPRRPFRLVCFCG